MKWWHKHWWAILVEDALGRFAKQEGQEGSEFFCRGSVELCSCGGCRFVPHDRTLRPVPCEP